MRIVVALGGNAILARGDRGTVAEQRARIRAVSDELAALVLDGHELVVTHGNGPQVGRLMLQDETLPDRLPRFPLDVHVAATQGQLGYLIQQELAASLRRVRAPHPVASIVTQVLVEASDPAFVRPSKPVGPYLSTKGAAEYRARGIPIEEVSGGGWRRVVPSPEPREIIESDVIRAAIAGGIVPVAAGGGGIPVVQEGGTLRGVAAVIDKDLTAAVLTIAVSADLLLILTDVDRVCADYGTDRARPLDLLSVKEARSGVEDGSFPRGSMGEKVLAGARVAEAGAYAVITSLGRARAAVTGDAGTRIAR